VESDARILGDGDFVAGLLREADHRFKRQLRLGEKRRSAEQGIQEFCEQVGAQEEELRRGGQRRNVSDVRARISSRLRYEGGLFLTEIARHVGICASAVAKAIRRLETENKK